MGGKSRRLVASFALVTAAGLLAPVAAQKPGSPADIAKRVQKARDTVATLSDRLRAQLATAIKSGGAVSAIGLCQTISPDLTTNATEEFGFEVVRTSFKLRNPENAPDDWERKVLQLFQSKGGSSAEVGKLEYHEVVTTSEGEKLFRYMRPIMVSEMCLACHGTDVKQDVKAEIARYYPDDKALGYKLGEFRGAFSLAQLITE